ncbi:MAG: ABC transporter permease [Muribaculaceae bacterium]|nr:ABC transporter permease [Muribaculaceae bacterium]
MLKDNWTYVITPKRKWLDIDLKELWRYRDLLYMYVKRDFVVQYKQTILGPLWFFISPIFTIIMFVFVFENLAGLSTDDVPGPLFYMSGIMLWNYFADTFNGCSNIFTENAGIFGKIYFPRLIVPFSKVIFNLFKFGIQLLLFLVLYFWFWGHGANLSVNLTLLLFPVLILMIGMHGMTWGLVISSITYKYHDLNVVIGFILGLFMYATPVVYPIDGIPEKYARWIELNPLSSIFQAFKYGAMGCGSIDWWGLLYSFVFLLIVSVGSVLLFNRVERNFMDTV